MSVPVPALKYLQGYSAETLAQLAQLIASGRLGTWLPSKCPCAHAVRTDKALFGYVQELRQRFLHGAAPLSKVVFDSKLHVVAHALGTHSTISRVPGSQLRTKREIRIATLFKEVPPEFLKMIVVHELAHLKKPAHDRVFYQLCTHMACPCMRLDHLQALRHLGFGDAGFGIELQRPPCSKFRLRVPPGNCFGTISRLS